MNTTDPKSFPEIECPNAFIHYRPKYTKLKVSCPHILPSALFVLDPVTSC